MGVWLLAIESLILSLLFAATSMAWRARKPSSFRIMLSRLIIFAPLLAYATGLLVYSGMSYSITLSYTLGGQLTFLFLGYSLGLWMLHRRGRSNPPTDLNPAEPIEKAFLSNSGRWPLGKLACATALVLTAQGLTFWKVNEVSLAHIEHVDLQTQTEAASLLYNRSNYVDNAARFYYQSFELIPPEEQWPEQRQRWTAPLRDADLRLSLPDPELSAFITDQRALFAMLDQATKRNDCAFKRKKNLPSIFENPPGMEQLRQAAWLYYARAQLKAEQGDLAAALSDIQRMLRMADHAAADPNLMSLYCSFSISNDALDALQIILNHRQPAAADCALIHGDTNFSYTPALTRAIQMDQVAGLSVLNQLATQPQAIEELVSMFRLHKPELWLLAALPVYRLCLHEADVDYYRQVLTQFQLASTLPYSQAYEEAVRLRQVVGADQPRLFVRLVVTSLTGVIDANARATARRRVALTAVAIHRYRAEQGKLPAELADLVPEYLPDIPIDPYDQKLLRWKITGEEWGVYSIAEDLRDNAGAEWKWSGEVHGDYGFYSTLPAVAPPPDEDNADDTANVNSETNNE